MLLTSMDIRLTSGHLACYHYSQDICILEKEMTKKLNKECAETYYNRGLAHSKKGELELAIADYTKAIELKPDYADAYYRRSKAWLHLGEKKKQKRT